MKNAILGYPTQAEAIEALFQQGRSALEISSLTNVPRASVDMTLSRYRKRLGIPAAVFVHGNGCVWELPEGERRQAIAIRAASGARKALEAAGL
jgi:hypothetical protein